MKNRNALKIILILVFHSLLIVGCQKSKIDNEAELEKISNEVRASLEGEIVFNDYHSGIRKSVAKSGGSGILLYSNGTALNGLKWSPDGSKVAFTDGSNSWDLVICNHAGVIEHKWGIGSPFDGFRGISWSPDGNTIAALSKNGNTIIYIEIDSGKLTNTELVTRPGYFYSSIDWWPEGNKIAIAECSSVGYVGGGKNIWMLEAYENDPQKDPNSLLVTNSDPLLSQINYMDWSMDGSKLVYSEHSAYSPIYVVNSDETGNQEIILKSSDASKKLYGFAPCWMANSTQIIYTGVTGVSGSTLIFGLFVTDINGSYKVDLNIPGEYPDCY